MGLPFPKWNPLFNSYFADLKARAKNRGIPFSLTKDETYSVITKDCFYCGQPPSQVTKKKRYKGEFIHSGLDRVCSRLPYSSDNIVACCIVCNVMKNTFSFSMFLQQIRRIYKHHEKTKHSRTDLQDEVYGPFKKRIMR